MSQAEVYFASWFWRLRTRIGWPHLFGRSVAHHGGVKYLQIENERWESITSSFCGDLEEGEMNFSHEYQPQYLSENNSKQNLVID